MNRAVVVLFVAEIRPPRPLLVLGNMERVIDQFLYTTFLAAEMGTTGIPSSSSILLM